MICLRVFYPLLTLFFILGIPPTLSAQENLYFAGSEFTLLQTKEIGNGFDFPCIDCDLSNNVYRLSGGFNGFIARRIGTHLTLRLNFGYTRQRFANEYTLVDPLPTSGTPTTSNRTYFYKLDVSHFGMDLPIRIFKQTKYELHFSPGVLFYLINEASSIGNTSIKQGDGYAFTAKLVNVFPIHNTSSLLLSPYFSLANSGIGSSKQFLNHQQRFQLVSFGIQFGLQFDLSRGAAKI